MKHLSFLIAAAALLAGCSCVPAPEVADPPDHEEHEDHAEGEIHLSAEQREIAGIRVVAVKSWPGGEPISVPATVRSTSKGKAHVTPPTDGRIVRLFVEPGQRVQKGQGLAVFQSADLARAWQSVREANQRIDESLASLEQDQGAASIAESRAVAARKAFNRQKELADAAELSQEPLLAAQAELADAEADRRDAQQRIKTHSEQVRRLERLYGEGIVALIEVENARLEVRQDRIELQEAEAKVRIAWAKVDRERRLASGRTRDLKEVERAQAELDSSLLEAKAAMQRVAAARQAVSNARENATLALKAYRSMSSGLAKSGDSYTLSAPISGVITTLHADTGESVSRTQALATIENLQAVWMTAQVAESDLAKISVGDVAEAKVPALPDQSFDGIVQIIEGALNPDTRTAQVQCLIEGAAGRLKTNMSGQVTIFTGDATRSISIPESAVVKAEDGHQMVFVAEGEDFHQREVELGRLSGGRYVVEEGLAEGEMIVAEGAEVLRSELIKAELKGHEH